MLWVLAAIACFVVLHTVVNVAYRKPEPAHQPAAEARERHRGFVQGDMKGWTRYAAKLEPAPADVAPLAPSAPITREPAPKHLATVLPFDLVGIFTTDPRLRAGPANVTAPASTNATGALRVRLQFDAATSSEGFGEPLAFAKDQRLYLFIQDESRTVLDDPPTAFTPNVEISLPPGVLPAGDWQVALYTRDAIFTWRSHVPLSASR